MTTEPIVEQDPAAGLSSSASDEQLIAMLVDRARGDGLKLTGEGGLLQKLTKRVLESALEGEITDHVGYDKHDAQGGVAETPATPDFGVARHDLGVDTEGSGVLDGLIF